MFAFCTFGAHLPSREFDRSKKPAHCSIEEDLVLRTQDSIPEWYERHDCCPNPHY